VLHAVSATITSVTITKEAHLTEGLGSRPPCARHAGVKGGVVPVIVATPARHLVTLHDGATKALEHPGGVQIGEGAHRVHPETVGQRGVCGVQQRLNG
jgi:hypothetical protein